MASLNKSGHPSRIGFTENWVDWTHGGRPAAEAELDGIADYDAAHRRVVRDWLLAIDEKARASRLRRPRAEGDRDGARGVSIRD